MATILTKKKDTTGAPGAGDLTNSTGGAELAVNTADKRLYTKNSGGSVVEVGTNPGEAVTFVAGSASTPAITTTGDTNTGIFFPAADTIAFAEGGAEAMRIDSSGNVQVGTTAGALANERFNVTSSNNAITSLVSATNASQSNDIFRVNAARNTTNGSYNTFSVYNTGAAAYRFILTDGGNISTFGGQITFPATQSASSNANTLDDYEEGTWTPALSIETSGSVTYSLQSGSYTRVGNAVIATGVIGLSATSSPTGGLGLTGLPFSAASFNAVNFGWVRNLGSAGIILRGYTNANATTCTLSKNATNAGNTDLAGSDLTSTTSLAFSISYLI